MVLYMEKYFILQINQRGQFCCKTWGHKGFLGGDAAPVTQLHPYIVFLGQDGVCVRQFLFYAEAALQWCHTTV